MEITINITEQTLNQIMQSIAQAFQPQSSPSSSQTNVQLDALQKENTALREQIQNIQAQINKMKEGRTESEVQSLPVLEASSDLAWKGQAATGNHTSSAKNGKLISQPEEVKAERWTREHIEKWLDTPCQFAKTQGRTWRELAENQGEKIEVKGRL